MNWAALVLGFTKAVIVYYILQVVEGNNEVFWQQKDENGYVRAFLKVALHSLYLAM